MFCQIKNGSNEPFNKFMERSGFEPLTRRLRRVSQGDSSAVAGDRSIYWWT